MRYEMKNQGHLKFDLFDLTWIFQDKWVNKQSCTNKNTPHEVIFRPKLLPPRNSQNRSLCIRETLASLEIVFVTKNCHYAFIRTSFYRNLHIRVSTLVKDVSQYINDSSHISFLIKTSSNFFWAFKNCKNPIFEDNFLYILKLN